ncbi:hypothetical protein BP5796_04819 [Coleophoma crateriformis]|uniref:Sorting nexin C-terminal domain-containing protein n=1 Tax=Coleophoma crateriformis TaxID=565419 RepID=A0A3D8SC42_9HELO|nr:hypothetical protein BP5796_04819 [Coleophoma crateriformis]
MSTLLSNGINKHVLDASLLPMMLRNMRAAVFPNNTLGPPRITPTAAEELLIRRRCAETLLSLVPERIQDIYFGRDKERRIGEVEEVLNIFSDRYCNKHLLYGIVELIIVRLMPELADKGIEELWEERLN